MAFGGEILTGKWHTGGSQELEAVYVLIRVAVTQVYIHIYIYMQKTTGLYIWDW